MTIVPRYNFLPGTEITLLNRPMVVNGTVEGGYSMVGLEDGVATVVSYNRMVEHLSLPGAQINAAQAANGDRHRKRLGGYFSAKSLPNKEQRALGQFHFAMCQAVDIFVAMRQQEDPKFAPTVRKLGTESARKFIAAQTALLLGERVWIKPPRGGEEVKGRLLYQGRTIYEYFQIYQDLAPDERSAEALVTLSHLRGNRSSRLPLKLRHLMTEAWEKIGLDKKGTSIAKSYA